MRDRGTRQERTITARDVECPHCGAKEGRQCHTRDGYEIRTFHKKRVEEAGVKRYLLARARGIA